jgi:hypothetical protein
MLSGAKFARPAPINSWAWIAAQDAFLSHLDSTQECQLMFASAIGLAQLLVMAAVSAGPALPFGLPPEKPDAAIAAAAPQECLVYVSWAGTATPDAASTNRTERLLAEPEIQLLLGEIERRLTQGLSEAIKEEGPEAQFAAEQSLKWSRTLLTRPAALFVSRVNLGPEGPDVQGGMVVNVGDAAGELQALLVKLLDEAPPGAAEKVQIGGATMYRVQLPDGAPAITAGVKGQYFVAGVGDQSVEGILQRMQAAAPPSWLAGLHKQLPVERPSQVVYVNIAGIRTALAPLIGDPEVDRVLNALGFGNVTSAACVNGLDGDSFVSRTLAGLDGEPTGLLSPAADKPLTAADLKPIPRDATFALATRLNVDKFIETMLASAGQIDPRVPEEIQRELGQLEEEIGIRVRDDLLKSLGDVWCVYHSSAEGGLLGGFTAVVSVRDHDRLQKVRDRFFAMAQAMQERQPRGQGLQVRRVTFAGEQIDFLSQIEEGMPFAPAWCVTEKELIVGMFPQNIKAYLSRGAEFESIAAVPEVASVFQSGPAPFKLAYADTPALFEMAYPFVQIFAQFLVKELQREGIDVDISLLPSGQTIRRHLRPSVISVARTPAGIEATCRQTLPGAGTALALLAVAGVASEGRFDIDDIANGISLMVSPSKARQVESMNNMKQIALAMHNYHDVYGKLPAAYTADADGRPLLSWRVAILPFLEQAPLYDRFRQDEPWDSDHNKKLIPLMPRLYYAPSDAQIQPGVTNYLTVRGKNTIFSGKDAISFARVPDGTSNTIMTVEASDQKAVIWTKPDDFQYDEKNPAAGLVGLRKNGFIVGFADGSVRLIKATIDKEVLNRLFDRQDGNPIDYRDLE